MTIQTKAPQGLQPVPVRIRSLGKEVGDGTTVPYHCTLSGILKFDHSAHAPNCVYDELVAMRLGMCVGAPVASGALVSGDRGEGFVSLKIGAVNFSLPDLQEAKRWDAVTAFPNHAASLVAFDIFIGNIDRGSNLKADITRKNLNFFAAFDHSHALLDWSMNPGGVTRLGTKELIVDDHPFYRAPALRKARVLEYARRIAALPEQSIYSACMFGDTFRQVTEERQEALADALCERRKLLPQIIESHAGTIFEL